MKILLWLANELNRNLTRVVSELHVEEDFCVCVFVCVCVCCSLVFDVEVLLLLQSVDHGCEEELVLDQSRQGQAALFQVHLYHVLKPEHTLAMQTATELERGC